LSFDAIDVPAGLLLITLLDDYFRIKVTRVIRQHRSK
jgi:hypothetical protein